MDKRNLLIISLVIFLGLSLAIYQYANELRAEIVGAYSASKPSYGHSWSEMECGEGLCISGDRVGIGGDPSTTDNLKVTGTIQATGSISSGGDVCNGSNQCLSDIKAIADSQILVYANHTIGDCEKAKGRLENTDTSFKQCRFSLSSCPGGWKQYQQYSRTEAGTCGRCNCHCGDWPGCFFHGVYGYSTPRSCTTPFHSWNNASQEHCKFNYEGGVCNSMCGGSIEVTCDAKIVEIGCY